MKKIIMITAAFSFAAITARADWDPGDPYKMHFPQMPDPNGWDINIHDFTLADDWQCSETGPVSDVHFWVSYQGDGPPNLNTITLSIHNDVPAGTDGVPYSRPGPPVWGITTGEFTSRGPFIGDQGFAYDPGNPDQSQWVRPDHTQYWQINVTNIQDAFIQHEGNIYWLDVHAENDLMVGWKTTTDRWNDKAVFWDEPNSQWLPIVDDPTNGEPIGMSFVITPEPQSSALAALGFGLLCLRRRRNAAR